MSVLMGVKRLLLSSRTSLLSRLDSTSGRGIRHIQTAHCLWFVRLTCLLGIRPAEGTSCPDPHLPDDHVPPTIDSDTHKSPPVPVLTDPPLVPSVSPTATGRT